MGDDVRHLLKRSRQLDVLAYILIGSLVVAAGLLTFVALAGLRVPDTWLLANPVVRVLVGALIVALIIYMGDQHRRLRLALLDVHGRLESAKDDIAAAYDRMAFAYHTAELMTSLARTDGLRIVLADSVRHFGADAAAVVGREIELATSEGTDAAAGRDAVETAARPSGSDHPDTDRDADDPGDALTAPLHVRGGRDATMVVWKRSGGYSSDDAEGLKLVSRILEMGLENRALLEEVKAQLSGTLQAMVDLVERRCPNYVPQAMTVASYAVAIGKVTGMSEPELADLRLAAMLHDIGMLDVPEAILSAPRLLTDEEMAVVATHSQKGADIAKLANFGPGIQKTILCHHERIDGTGYPRGLSGPAIPVEARIISVCDSYVAMISDRPHRPRMSSTDAINQLRAEVGEHFDPTIVREFVAIRAGGVAEDPDAAQRPE